MTFRFISSCFIEQFRHLIEFKPNQDLSKSVMEPTPLAERFRQREINRKWIGKEVTGQIEALKRRLPTAKEKLTPFTKHLFDVLKEFIAVVGD